MIRLDGDSLTVSFAIALCHFRLVSFIKLELLLHRDRLLFDHLRFAAATTPRYESDSESNETSQKHSSHL